MSAAKRSTLLTENSLAGQNWGSSLRLTFQDIADALDWLAQLITHIPNRGESA